MTRPMHTTTGRTGLRVGLCVLSAFLAGGCALNIESMIEMRDVRLTEDVEKAAARLIEVAAAPKKDLGKRCIAVKCLARLRSKQVVPALGVLAKSARNSSLRQWAAWALGESGDPDAVHHLTAVIRSHADAQTTAPALEGLAKYAIVICTKPHVREDVLVCLEKARSRFPRSRAASDLGRLLFEELRDLDTFRRVLKGALDRRDQRGVFTVAGWIGQHLLEYEGELDEDDRRAAIADLSELVSHGTDVVRHRALWYLGRIADKTTGGALLEAAKNGPDSGTKLLAWWALSRVDMDLLLRNIFQPLPDELLKVTPENYLRVHRAVQNSGEQDIEIHRYLRDLLSQRGRR